MGRAWRARSVGCSARRSVLRRCAAPRTSWRRSMQPIGSQRRRWHWPPSRFSLQPLAFDLDSALAQAYELGASDLHLKVPSEPRVRLGGTLHRLEGGERITPSETEAVADQV